MKCSIYDKTNEMSDTKYNIYNFDPKMSIIACRSWNFEHKTLNIVPDTLP